MLGTEQHGHMVNIGYELYCKMVDDAVRALEGEIVNEDREETTGRAVKLWLNIPETYIFSEPIKLQMYKKIASVRTRDDEDEIIDELTDRFGDVPQQTINLIKISHIRYLAGLRCLLTEIKQNENKVVLSFDAKNPLSGFGLGQRHICFRAEIVYSRRQSAFYQAYRRAVCPEGTACSKSKAL